MISFMKSYELAFKTLDILADGAFHSGEKIAIKIGCSRVTVWKAINELKTLGIVIFSVRNKGYRLEKSVSILNESIIRSNLGELAQFIHFELNHVIDSTNNYLMQFSSDRPHATVVASNIQTKGKGRRGRTWQAQLGESLTLSILWKFTKGASQLSGLSLVIGLAIQRTMKKLGIENSYLKWPNDLLMKIEDNFYKIAGVLIELQGDMESRTNAVIGIGINYDLSDRLLKKIDQPAIGIKGFIEDQADLNKIIALLIQEIVGMLKDFDTSGFINFKDEWLLSNAFDGKTIEFLKTDGELIRGKIINLASNGALVLLNDSGDEEHLLSGEVSQIKSFSVKF